MPCGNRYHLTLRLLPEDGIPDAIRLRHALKCLLRSYGIRCETIFSAASENDATCIDDRNVDLMDK